MMHGTMNVKIISVVRKLQLDWGFLKMVSIGAQKRKIIHELIKTV
jgi:hypothetical protein